ncbi:MAG TPA: hypothetical protein V6D19_02195, partial [Stenomitos sp.]
MALDHEEVDALLGFEPQPQALTKGVMGQKLEASVEQRPWYTRLSTKVFIVGGVGFIVTLLAFNLFGSSESQTTATTKDNEANQLLQSQLAAQQQQNADLKTQMAIGNQQKMLLVKPMTMKPTKPSKPPANAVSYQRTLPMRSVPATVASAPTLPRSAPAPSFPVRSLPTFVPPPQQSQLITSVPSSARAPEDPMTAWERLSGLGHYTSGDASSSSATLASSTASPSYTPAVYTQSGPATAIESSYSGNVPNTAHFNAPSEPSRASLGSYSGVTLNAGTTAKGKLVTPILWAGDIDVKDQEFLVELRDGLGKALPKGTLIVVTPEQTSESGFIRLKAVRASVNGSDQVL